MNYRISGRLNIPNNAEGLNITRHRIHYIERLPFEIQWMASGTVDNTSCIH